MRNIQIRYCIEKSTQDIMKPILICIILQFYTPVLDVGGILSKAFRSPGDISFHHWLHLFGLKEEASFLWDIGSGP